jgi:deoxyribodipyrimidine photolyase
VPALLWFRRDLRLRDLPSLLAAADVDGEVLGCFVLDPWKRRRARVDCSFWARHYATSAMISMVASW